MNSSEQVGVIPVPGHDDAAGSEIPAPFTLRQLGAPVRCAIMRTRQWLLANQHAEGCWCAELQGDTILESETILLLAYLGSEDSELAHKLAAYLLEEQLPGGGWAMYPGGSMDVSGSVKAYFALKLTGADPGSEPMQRARRAILAHGGADAVNSYTRFYLALLGQISYEQCPAVPPELTLLPKWFPVNLYRVSSWSRTIIVPLSIISARRPVRRIDPRLGIRELFLSKPRDWPPLRCPGRSEKPGLLSWDRFFRLVDLLLKWYQRHSGGPLRRRAIAAAKRWMLDRFEGSDGLGAIYPPIVWSIIALKSLGYHDESPELKECYDRLDALVIDRRDSNSARLQPCKSPVWDTAIALRALSAGGVRHDAPAVCRAIDWLLDRQITRRGDWSETVDAEPGGWAFEYANEFYPDVDDTAMVIMALAAQFSETSGAADGRCCEALPPELRLLSETTAQPAAARDKVAAVDRSAAAIERGIKWILAMQNDDGGWGAFDKNNNCKFLCHVPFADHNAMIDPSCADITGRVLEMLGKLGRRLGDPAVDRAVRYLRNTQEPDGSWFGRWGVNYIYGTWEVITGLVAAGVPTDDATVAGGANWLLAHQQPCGGWGESADSYEDPRLRGQGPTTPSQTAWAVLGLLEAGLHDHPAVNRAVRFLVAGQNDDGTWDEPEFTGTGFPRVFYLRYHYYPICFPLLALSEWVVKVDPLLAADDTPELRLVCD